MKTQFVDKHCCARKPTNCSIPTYKTSFCSLGQNKSPFRGMFWLRLVDEFRNLNWASIERDLQFSGLFLKPNYYANV